MEVIKPKKGLNPLYYIRGLLVINYFNLLRCHGMEAVATERMYSRSLQDVARSIARVEGVRR